MTGVYIILAELKKESEIRLKSGHRFSLQKGYYCYVGSAMNGLEKRVERHLRIHKKFYWHIDFLLKKAKIKMIIVSETKRKMECKVAQALCRQVIPIRSFGCSDCKCVSHLFFSSDMETLKAQSYDALKNCNLPSVLI